VAERAAPVEAHAEDRTAPPVPPER
jgi:hypothetical protein